jgi:hypothetical protein
MPVKVLAGGDLDRALTVRAHKFSARAVAKIQAAGGRAESLEGGDAMVGRRRKGVRNGAQPEPADAVEGETNEAEAGRGSGDSSPE